MNNYILAYYQAIKDGTEIVSKWVALIYEIIVKGLENKSFYYDPKKAQAAVKFIENFCRHTKGNLAPQKLKLELWEKALVSLIFGIVDKDDLRQFREVVLVVARKNGKTLLCAAIAEYCTFLDGEYGGEIYFCAPKLEQSNICFDAYYQSIIKEPVLDKLAQKRRTDVYVAENNTKAKPLAFSAKKSDGFNISLAIADEFASWQGDAGLKFYEVIKSSQGARRQPLIIAASSAGYVNEGIYDELIKRSTRYLLGNSKETRLLPILYMIDDPKKWNDINELRKSNPNLGVSVSVDYLIEEIAVAEESLSKKAEFMTKYCNVKQNSSQAWLSAVTVENACREKINLEDFRECYCVGGIDLSLSVDLTAALVVIEKDGILNVVAKFFLPNDKLEEATARDGLPYKIFVDKGFLMLSGDNTVDYKDCFNWFVELVEQYHILPLKTGYDRYCAQYLVKDMQNYGFHMDDVWQGFNLSPVINEAEGLFKDGKINIGDNDLLKVHLLNSAIKSDSDSLRRRLVKVSEKEHIDGMAALLDALTVRQKYCDEVGRQLRNER